MHAEKANYVRRPTRQSFIGILSAMADASCSLLFSIFWSKQKEEENEDEEEKESEKRETLLDDAFIHLFVTRILLSISHRIYTHNTVLTLSTRTTSSSSSSASTSTSTCGDNPS
uniref:Uncharacterized protein n=1 Tax=Glossina pallidipes TaxID=7398 RepID=A0A1B0AHL3_GLOPL